MFASLKSVACLSFLVVFCSTFDYILARKNSVLPDNTVCGYQEEKRIFGGTLTEIGEFPWMVLLRYKYADDNTDAGFKCGGTLINNRYILTAAHCVALNRLEEIEVGTVRLGEWRISTVDDCEEDLANEECADPVVDVRVEKLIPHPLYKQKSIHYDIALIRIDRDVPYTDYVRPICLPLPTTISQPGKTYMISGWGATENGSLSDLKLKLEVPLVSLSTCSQKVKTRGQLNENHLCAGGEHGKDACQGDSGGPLMLGTKYESQTQWTQEGVISYGNGCGRKGVPAVYTRVARYMDWILSNLEE